MRKLILTLSIVVLTGPASAQDQNEIAFVKAMFNKLQPLSFSRNREYCGYLGYDPQGKIAASRARRGGRDGCRPIWPKNLEVFASYHTHAAYEYDADSEVPSVDDIEADEADGVDGYVATPGGRLWYIDTEDMVVSQICSIGCLRQDEDFVKGVAGRIAQSYTYRQLLRRAAEN